MITARRSRNQIVLVLVVVLVLSQPIMPTIQPVEVRRQDTGPECKTGVLARYSYAELRSHNQTGFYGA
jgi:hypothetical protein